MTDLRENAGYFVWAVPFTRADWQRFQALRVSYRRTLSADEARFMAEFRVKLRGVGLDEALPVNVRFVDDPPATVPERTPSANPKLVGNGSRVSDDVARAVRMKLGVLVPLEALRAGIEVELEHTDDPFMAGKIALDHMKEFPDYYDRLAIMEERAKAGLAPNARRPKRYRSIPPFLRSDDAAFAWAAKNVDLSDIDEEEDLYRGLAFAYSNFAETAYRAGVVPVFRALRVPVRGGQPQIDFKCLGKAWSREPSGARVYGIVPHHGETRDVVIAGMVSPEDVDWEYGFTSFMYYGEDQWEVSMLENSPVLVTHVDGQELDPAREGSTGPAGESWADVCGKLTPNAVARATAERLPSLLPEWARLNEKKLAETATRATPVDAIDCLSDAEVEKMLFGVSSMQGTIMIDPDDITWDPERQGSYEEVMAEVEEEGESYYDTEIPIIVDLTWDGTLELNDGHHRVVVNQERGGGEMSAEVQIPPGLAKAWARKLLAQRAAKKGLAPNARKRSALSRTRVAFDRCFDEVANRFPDFGDVELHQDEKAGADNGRGAERQFGYCEDGKTIRVAFAAKIENLPEANIRGLVAHEFGHAIDYRYGKRELERLLGRRLPDGVEKRADAIAEAVFGTTIKYDAKDVQCVSCQGQSPRPRRLGA